MRRRNINEFTARQLYQAIQRRCCARFHEWSAKIEFDDRSDALQIYWVLTRGDQSYYLPMEPAGLITFWQFFSVLG